MHDEGSSFHDGVSCGSSPFLHVHSSGTGSHYGTLSGPIEAFSTTCKPMEAGKSPGKNFLTTPGKKGTGFGYVGVAVGVAYSSLMCTLATIRVLNAICLKQSLHHINDFQLSIYTGASGPQTLTFLRELGRRIIVYSEDQAIIQLLYAKALCCSPAGTMEMPDCDCV